MAVKEITSLQHPIVKHLVKLRTSSAYRKEQRSVLVAGNNGVRELAEMGLVKTLFSSDSVDALPIAPALREPFDPAQDKPQDGAQGRHYKVTPEIMKKISGVVSPGSLAAECILPDSVDLSQKQLVLVLDGVSDPGNLGTLLRTALSFGWDGAFILPSSCDPYNEKALRAAKGATFRLPLQFGTVDDLKKMRSYHVYVADPKGEATSSFESPSTRLRTSLRTAFQKPMLLVLGNEAHGVSIEVRALGEPVAIPMKGDMESLNVAVAGGVLLYLGTL